MHFYTLIRELSIHSKLDIFIDMDGVIASYEIGKPYSFKEKRPLKTNIELFKNISKLSNVELHILSVCRKNNQIEEKNEWLDINMPFIEDDKRHILSKETFKGNKSSELKLKYLQKYKTNNKIIMIDDDNEVLKLLAQNIQHVILFQDSELID